MIGYVTVEKFCDMTGYSVDAVDKKRANGIWLEGVVWFKAPDNRILMSIEGYNAWVERRPGSVADLTPVLKSTSAIAGTGAVSELTSLLRRGTSHGRKTCAARSSSK